MFLVDVHSCVATRCVQVLFISAQPREKIQTLFALNSYVTFLASYCRFCLHRLKQRPADTTPARENTQNAIPM